MLVMLIAGIIMALLVLFSHPVPNPVAWVFFAGVIITLASALFMKKSAREEQ